MANFTEQQVKDAVLRRNLEDGQTFQQQKKLGQQEEDLRWQWQADRDEELARKREMDALPKEEGIVDMVKKNVKTKVAQEVASYAVKKAIEKLPSLIASLS